MTVALLGIGADSTNAAPTPPVYPDGTFEYVPIPEARGPDGTTETRTYGTVSLRHAEGTMADYLTSITPRPGDGPTLTGDALAAWPLHHDPNFEGLTYGETTSRGSYTTLLRTLDPGDAVAFYTGLRGPDADYRHRYVIGWFTVATVRDCRRVEHDGGTASFTTLSTDEQQAIMGEHAENAHAKRFAATGELHAGDGLVIVDGRPPGGLLDTAVRLSEPHASGHHYLTDEMQRRLQPVPGGNPDRNAHLGGVKTAHRLDIAPARFREIVE